MKRVRPAPPEVHERFVAILGADTELRLSVSRAGDEALLQVRTKRGGKDFCASYACAPETPAEVSRGWNELLDMTRRWKELGGGG